MKRLLITLFMMSVMPAGNLMAQEGAQGCWLGFGWGAGIGSYNDFGTCPQRFIGFEIHPTISFLLSREKWRIEAIIPLSGGMYMRSFFDTDPSALALMPEIRADALWKVWGEGRWRVLAGVGAAEMFDLRYYPDLGNNNVGTSNFLMFYAGGRGELRASPFVFHTQLMFSPVGYVYRPGFAYIANYDHTMQDPVADHFEGHHGYAVGAGALRWETGATLFIRHGNSIGVSYRWHHLTSRTSAACPYRFDRASHAFIFTLNVGL